MILTVKGLRLVRGRREILAIDELSVAPHEVLAVVGPNGAGKSSLLQSLALLAPAQFDQYIFAGQTVRLPAEALAIRRQLSVVFQEPLLLSTSVVQNAASGLLLRGVARPTAYARARALLERLGIAHLADRPAHQLSGGEAQRVSLARALVVEPKLLCLDEPFSALDVLTRSALLSDLRPLLQETGTTALLVTHDVTEVAQLADRVLVIEAGRLVQTGTPAEVLSSPRTAVVKRMAEIAAQTAKALAPLAQRSGDGDHRP